MKNDFPLCLALLTTVLSCTSPPEQKTEKPKTVLKTIPVPDFNADSAYFYIEQQVAFGPRVPNTASHDSCADFLIDKLNSFKFEVTTQKGIVKAFDGTQLNITNIIAQINPGAKNRIMLCAHWDTRPFADQDVINKTEPIEGANDGGSGVGVLLEIARQVGLSKPHIGVDIILFDGEDYGKSTVSNSYCLGAQYWAENLPITNYYPKYGILLDMVGAENALFYLEGYSMQFAPHVIKHVWKTAAKLGYSHHFVFRKTNPTTDDHLYVNTIAKIPCIDIIQHDPTTTTGFGAYWHTHNDNMSVINKNTLKAVGQTLLEVIYTEQ